MFIEKADLPTVIYGYQLDEITEGDNLIIVANCAAAIEEVKSYLAKYDTATIFAATGAARNPLILEITKSVALWYIIRLSNVDMIYDQAKDRYDRAITWLKSVKEGDLAPNLPHATAPDGGAVATFSIKSNRKFNHGNEY